MINRMVDDEMIYEKIIKNMIFSIIISICGIGRAQISFPLIPYSSFLTLDGLEISTISSTSTSSHSSSSIIFNSSQPTINNNKDEDIKLKKRNENERSQPPPPTSSNLVINSSQSYPEILHPRFRKNSVRKKES